MAMDIIAKHKKEILWRGLPHNQTTALERAKGDKQKIANHINKQRAYIQVGKQACRLQATVAWRQWHPQSMSTHLSADVFCWDGSRQRAGKWQCLAAHHCRPAVKAISLAYPACVLQELQKQQAAYRGLLQRNREQPLHLMQASQNAAKPTALPLPFVLIQVWPPRCQRSATSCLCWQFAWCVLVHAATERCGLWS